MAITQVSNSLVKQDLTISGGTVDNTVIGSGTPAAGTFTTVAGTLASTVTGTTAAASDNSTKIATTAYVTTAIANLVDTAPAALNTLNELAAALGDDANFATTVNSSIAAKANIAAPNFTGNVTFDTTTLTVDATNNRVGIGTTSPASPLTINGTDPLITFENGESPHWQLGFENTNSDRFVLYDNNASAYRLIVDSSGNVGIGIAPTKKLTVFGTGAGNATVQIEGEGGADPYINFLANNTQHWSVGVDDSDDDKFKISEHSALGTNDYFTINTSGATTLSSTGSSAGFLYLNYIRGISDGNTGINIAGSDVLELQTGGSARVRIDTALKIIGQNTSHTASALAIGHEGSSISELRAYGVNAGTVGKLRMRVSASDGTGNSDAIFDQNGFNVGGVTAANKTLEIKGASNNDGYLGTFGSGYSLQVARHPLTGVFNNTSTAAAAINLFTGSADSAIAFYTTATNNANPTERMRIDKHSQVMFTGEGSGYTPNRDEYNGGYTNNLNAGAFGILHRDAYDAYITGNAYYNKVSGAANWRAKYGPYKSNVMSLVDGRFRFYASDTAVNAGAVLSGYAERLSIDKDGLKFGTDTAAANALDDYEEGTYATSFAPSNGTITLNASYDELGYTKIGNVVTVTGYLKVSSVSNPSGILYIGLPFTAASSAKYSAAALCVFNVTGSGTTSDSWSIIDNNSNTIQVYNGGGGSVAANWANRIVTNTDVRISATYIAA